VVTTWVALGVGVDTSASLTATEVLLLPGEQAVVRVPLLTPTTPGAYLLLLDVLTPAYGSLAAAGLAPATIRVVVEPLPEVRSPPDTRRHATD
jgi:hypothetical protein